MNARQLTWCVAVSALSACAPELASTRSYCGQTPDPDHAPFHHPDAERFQAMLDDAVDRSWPGVTLMVQNPAGVFLGASGQCDLGEDVAMQPFTRSRIGSVTKVFTAVATLRLAEEGLLGLDDAIADHLDPAMAERITNSGTITIRQLLNHTSGLPKEPMTVSAPVALDVLADDPTLPTTDDWYFDALYDRPALFEPGQGWAYSNFGYALLGPILEDAAQESRWQVLQSRVFTPLGLEDTFFDPHVRTPAGLARGYADLYGDGGLTDVSDWDGLHRLDTEGGVVSTVFDLTRFIDAVLNGDLLTASSKEEMLNCVPAAPDEGVDAFGLGIDCTSVDGKPAFTHAGEVIGYLAAVLAFPEQEAVVAVLVNGSFGVVEAEFGSVLRERLPPMLE